MKEPLISIIIPTYNRAYLIVETLDSVLNQVYQNWECIVVDDGSTDSTSEILARYTVKDRRFRYYEKKIGDLKGASVCRNVGFTKSKGKYIQYLDSDDLLSANKLYEQIKILEGASTYSIATTKWGRFMESDNDKAVYEDLESYTSFDSVEVFLTALANSKGYFPIHSYLINRKLIEKSGGWNDYLSLNDDGEFIMRLLVNVEKIYFLSEAHVFYRFGDGKNLSSVYHEQQVIDLINSFRMIECLFKIKFKVKSVYYIEKVKEGLYKNIIKKNQNLIYENKDFFSIQLKSLPLKCKIKNKLKMCFKYGK